MTEERAGPTGNFPEGKCCNDDEGELKIAFAADKANNIVIVDLGEMWFGATPASARSMARKLNELADLIDPTGGN